MNARYGPVEAVPEAEVSRRAAHDAVAGAGHDAEWRLLQATGTYDAGRPGAHPQPVLQRRTRLPRRHAARLADGAPLLVNRGWIPIGTRGRQAAGRPRPAERAPSQSKGESGAPRCAGRSARRDPSNGGAAASSPGSTSPDSASNSPYPVLPAYVELTASSRRPSQPLPALIPPPELDDGPHFAYAVQWFIFSASPIVGWVLVVRRQVHDDARKRRSTPGPEEQAPASSAPV